MILSQTFYTEIIKWTASNKNKIPKVENSENVSHLEITEVILVHFNIANNDYQQDSRVLYTFFPNKLFSKSLDISNKNFIFEKHLIRIDLIFCWSMV